VNLEGYGDRLNETKAGRTNEKVEAHLKNSKLFVWNLDMIRGTLFLSFAFVDNRHALSTSKRLLKSKSFIKLAINHIYIYMMSGVILIVFDDFPIYK
jgi:hypothetical protein